MGEVERGAGDVADLAGAGCDVPEGAPAAGEQGEPAFTQAAQGTLEGVVGPGIDIEVSSASGLLDGNQDADAGAALISRIGQGGQSDRSGRVERTIGDHVEPSSRSRSCGETSSTGAPRPYPGSPVRPRVCPDIPIWA